MDIRCTLDWWRSHSVVVALGSAAYSRQWAMYPRNE